MNQKTLTLNNPPFMLSHTMETTLGHQTIVAVGIASLGDVFQAGREAAQMAKRQLPERAEFNVVLALGPDTDQFQDFIEGVRLVTGEEKLIGIPLSPPNSNMVMILMSNNNQFELASVMNNANSNIMTTSLLTQFRQSRGNNRHQFDFHGLFCLSNTQEGPPQLDDVGLDSWFVHLVPYTEKSQPFICRDSLLNHGLMALECMTTDAVGMGIVNLEAFQHEPRAIHEATQLALREALHQMLGAEPAMGFIFINHQFKTSMGEQFSGSVHFPLVTIKTRSQYCQPLNRLLTQADNSVIALVIPQ